MCKYIVVDLEMCSAGRRKNFKDVYIGCEVIEIGAVLLNHDYVKIDSFKTYVKPQCGAISDKIQKLTGITYEDVKDAPLFEEALQLFCDWIPNEEVRMVSWSESDEAQIRREIQRKNIDMPQMKRLYENWIDCQAIFGELVERDRQTSLAEALIAADIIYEEGAHDALVDAHNTALLFAKMEMEESFVWNPYYLSAREMVCEHLQFGMGSLFQGICLGEAVG